MSNDVGGERGLQKLGQWMVVFSLVLFMEFSSLPSWAQDLTVSQRRDNNGFYTWTYFFTVERSPSAEAFKVTFRIPEIAAASATFTQVSTTPALTLLAASMVRDSTDSGYVWTVKYQGTAPPTPQAYSVRMTLSASDSVATNSADVVWEYCKDASKTECQKGTAAGPASAYDVSFFRPIIGTSFDFGRISRPLAFKVNTATSSLLIASADRTVPSIAVGGLFKLLDFDQHKHFFGPTNFFKRWGAFVSLDFTPGSDGVLDGLTLGTSLGITKYFEIFVGETVVKQHELRPGFRKAAAEYVKANNLEARYPLGQFGDDLARPALFDGFPVNDTSGKAIFAGDPLIDRYRGRFKIGVMFPIDLGNLLSKRP